MADLLAEKKVVKLADVLVVAKEYAKAVSMA